ncbi:GAF domain-containing protein [Actinotalea sp. Marseille-Q4924]|uniref:GAF domain-containing protein n=1 Tax=Actinotalea sp. Marseille-Q4924 TaxID=2866571 RepID=UPI001CE43545|nr:GAF domain-containing protein [Actinotalea sp. Marseille-Q4924]
MDVHENENGSLETDAMNGYAAAAAEELGSDTHCSITVLRRGTLAHVGSSDDRAAHCDQVEVRSGEGPCVTAMEQLGGILVPDLHPETRWPAWRSAALVAGFRSSAALPAYVDEGTTVALNLYSDDLDPWDRERLVGMDQVIWRLAEAVRTRLGA